MRHRGARLSTPENTLLSFQTATGLGVDGIELDVQRSADGVLVVVHDLTLLATTGIDALVMDTPSAVISAADAGSWFDPKFAACRVPRLDEVLALEGVDFEVEMKGTNIANGFAEQVLTAVASAGVRDRVEVTSSHLLLLREVRALDSTIRTGTFPPPRPAWMTERSWWSLLHSNADLVGATVLHVPASVVDDAAVARIHGWGYEVHAADVPLHTIPELPAGVDQVTSDIG